MAELTIIVSKMILLFLLKGAVSEEDSVDKDMKNATFECNVDFDDNRWKIQCASETGDNALPFFVAKLQGTLKPTTSLYFNELINSFSTFKSQLYRCERLLYPIFLIDPSVVVDHCRTVSKNLKYLTYVLSKPFIKSSGITNTSNFKPIMNILRESHSLTEVRIFNNSLSNFPVLQFHPNNSITTLILNHNRIERIAFRKYPNLKTLDLSHNFLKHANRSLFDSLKTVSNLDLSFNFIEIILNDTFSDMVLLKNILLQNNNLTYINKNIFKMNKMLQVIVINNNDIKILPPTIFHSLSDLRNISCSNCSLISLDDNIFNNSPKLECIILSHNQIQVVPVQIFSNQKFLKYIDLGFNNIKNINRNLFDFNPYLQFLNLTQNSIGSLKKGTFDSSPYIHVLDLSKNNLEILTDEYIQSFDDLEYFDLRQNKITMVELGVIKNVLIRSLFLSNNLISKLNIRWERLLYLEALHLDSNQLTDIDLPPCIPNVKQTITFSFRNNNISRIKLDSLIADEERVKINKNMMADCFFNGGAKNFVDLTNNPLLCDCDLYPFHKYIKEKFPRKYKLEVFLNKDNLTCAGPQYLKNERIAYLKDDVFACPFKEGCPVPCTCGVRGKDNMAFLNCSGQNMFEAPHSIPDGTTVLYFNGNKLQSMHSLNLKVWNHLKEFHIDNNSLKTLDDWNYPESLRYLSVRGNKLKTLPSSLMNFISNQSNFLLFFGDNDKNCSCDSEKLKLFLKERNDFIADTDRIVCKVTNNGTEAFLPLVSVPDSELCPLDSEGLNYKQKRMLISLCLFFTFLIVLLLAYYRHRQLILSFIYIHCEFLYRLFYRDDEFDEEKIFDAFVAYSSSDREIVLDLIAELEVHPPYFQLCIHERNWLPGRFICDNILSSVESSKRTIILLSDRFISSPWFNLELRAAVSKMSKDKIGRIIFILTEKTVSLSSVDLELQHVISRRTYLVWKERWFWEKLRYAMPRKRPVKHDDIMSCQPELSDIPLISETD